METTTHFIDFSQTDIFTLLSFKLSKSQISQDLLKENKHLITVEDLSRFIKLTTSCTAGVSNSKGGQNPKLSLGRGISIYWTH